MFTDKANAICLLKVLEEYSDDEHILTMRRIQEKMNLMYGVSPDRRTVYSAAALLCGLGYDISLYEDNGVGYYLRSRTFDSAEVRLLTDAAFSFPFISSAQTEQLISKLQSLLSVYERKRYRHVTVVRQDIKTPNKCIFRPESTACTDF